MIPQIKDIPQGAKVTIQFDVPPEVPVEKKDKSILGAILWPLILLLLLWYITNGWKLFNG